MAHTSDGRSGRKEAPKYSTTTHSDTHAITPHFSPSLPRVRNEGHTTNVSPRNAPLGWPSSSSSCPSSLPANRPPPPSEAAQTQPQRPSLPLPLHLARIPARAMLELILLLKPIKKYTTKSSAILGIGAPRLSPTHPSAFLNKKLTNRDHQKEYLFGVIPLISPMETGTSSQTNR